MIVFSEAQQIILFYEWKQPFLMLNSNQQQQQLK